MTTEPLGQSLHSEPTGNVVLRSDHFALRFFRQYGGVPLEFWSEPFPLLTNPFPGSAASIYYDGGQDSTQASSDGLSDNPIAIQSDPKSITKYNYFARETLYQPTLTPSYEVTGYFPDFILSHEPGDDYIIAPQQNWLTHYQHNSHPEFYQYDETDIYFAPVNSILENQIGFISPGNELTRNNTFQDLRNYPEGRFAARFNVSFLYAQNSNSEAGITFRKSFPNTSIPSVLATNDVYTAPGYHFIITSDFHWKFIRVEGNASFTQKGNLTKTEKALLKSFSGLELQVRTHNSIPGYIECYVNSRLVHVTVDPHPLLGSFSFLYANSREIVKFSKRKFYDVSIEQKVLYTALPDATIRSTHSWNPAPGAENTPHTLYRAGLTIFLNQTTFSAPDRTTMGLVWNNPVGAADIDADINNMLIPMSAFQSYWIGNSQGTCGLKATIKSAQLNNLPSPEAHLLMQQHSFNDEFILGLNILPPEIDPPTPFPFKNGKLVIDWQTKL